MKEVWKDIPNWKNYQASNLGRIKSKERYTIIAHGAKRHELEKIMSSHDDKDGYQTLMLSQNGKRKMLKVHRLVTQTFISNPENKPEVNHKDGNKANNCITNLEWNTTLENQKHAFATGLKNSTAENNGRAKLTWDDVNLIRKLREEYKFKVKRLMWLFDMSKSQINSIIYYKQWIKEV